MTPSQTYVGSSVRRLEDQRLVTGRGRYVDDLTLPGMLYAAVVRSQVAHARIRSVGKDAALAVPGVVAVYTAEDILPLIKAPIPIIECGVKQRLQEPDQLPLASTETVYEGEPIAVVLGRTREAAADGAAAADVDFDTLPAVTDLDEALVPGSPTTWADAQDNIAWDMEFEGRGDIGRAFADAAVTVRERIVQQRVAAVSIEARAVLADYRGPGQELVMWTSSQMPHFVRMYVAEGLGIPESLLRVVSPDVGGAFGAKMGPYPEEYFIPAASMLSGRPVKWTEERSENLRSTSHGRGHVFDVEASAAADGTLLGLRVVQHTDVGSHVGRTSANAVIAIGLSGGCYVWQAMHGRSVGVLTNKVWTGPYRGAGRPEATHLCERVIDLLAVELGMDPAELRRKNFIQDFPYENHYGHVYDSGAYAGALDKALEAVDYDGFRVRQEEARREGRYLGIGISSYVEIAGFGPSGLTAGNAREIGLVESAVVRVHPSGDVTISAGTHSHGQGHATSYAQLVADDLGIPIERIHLDEGDTANTPFGHGTYGSRSIPVGGSAIHEGCLRVMEKATRLAAHLLEVDPSDLSYADGSFAVRGTEAAVSFPDVAFAAYNANLPDGMEQGLEAVAFFDPPNFTWPFGTHVCTVEVDAQTGRTLIERYVAVDDCGTVVNPLLIEGQVHGGVLQGIAQALYEEISYDPDSGALQGGSFLDYLIPTFGERVPTEVLRTVTPTPSNPLGMKGVGEAGTIPASSAVINAVCDALSPLGIHHVDMPASPQRLWARLQPADPSPR